ncbi:S-adenosyl-L-methionine-dependent methyltransferase [Mycena galopus ATCC 62051]|nr:S-adenosyl-L-methionine-dependent methyltransferase [Mycena galopus ATCC 62051]
MVVESHLYGSRPIRRATPLRKRVLNPMSSYRHLRTEDRRSGGGPVATDPFWLPAGTRYSCDQDWLELGDPCSLINSVGLGEPDILVYTEDELELRESNNADGMPIRTISDFCIFDGKQMVGATELLGDLTSRSFTASGLVKAKLDTGDDGSDDDSDEEDGQFVRDLEITGFSIHHVSNHVEDPFDPNIYIETSRAWYILDTPAAAYKPFFIPLQIRHDYTHLIVSAARKNRKITYAKFVKSLEAPFTEEQLRTVDIVEYFRTYTGVIIYDFKKATNRSLSNVPLVQTLLKSQFSDHLKIQKDKAFVTPLVGSIVMPRIACPMTVVGSNSVESDPLPVDEYPEDDHHDPIAMHWGNPLNHPGYYDSVEVDGFVYKQGDIVAVAPGEDNDNQRAERAALSVEFCRNSYARRVWFIQIQYFFDNDMGTKMLHGQWFAHGGNTILQEFNHSQELFLLDECDNIHVSSIYRLCQVRRLEPAEAEIPDNGHSESTSYFYRLLWSKEEYNFKDLPTVEEEQRVVSFLPEHMPCANCGFVAEEKWRRQVQPLGPEVPNGFTRFGYDYHAGDFVFVKPKTASLGPLCIGQITNIEGLTVGELKDDTIVCSIRYFKRYAEDERRLYKTRKSNKVEAKDLDAVCYVKYMDQIDVDAIEEWLKADSILDRFYINTCESADGHFIPMHKGDFDSRICQYCARKPELQINQYHLRKGPISCLDVFAGAGGLSEGMHRTGYFDAKWAIEQSPSAARTFAANHPTANVLCADVNDILKYIVDREEGKQTTPLTSSDGSIIPDKKIPRPGEVDFVGGVLANRSAAQITTGRVEKYDHDTRTTLPYTLLSLVEVLSPTFFLLENVTGMMSFTAPKDGTNSVPQNGKRIEMAAVKLVYRVLIALGYQVGFSVLQAGQYGTPQDRPRLIFMGAKRGHRLPNFPSRTHSFPSKNFKIPLRRDDRIRAPTALRTDEEELEFAPHPAVTVNDAIGDMPAFDWINPHIRVRETPRDVAERRKREKHGILQCPVVAQAPVEDDATERWLGRPACHPGLWTVHRGIVHDGAFATVVEPPVQAILPRRMKNQSDNSPVFYGRLDGDGFFRTAMTQPRPQIQHSHFLHPKCKRALTLREFARSQGFPDSYTFCSTESTPAKQLQDRPLWDAVSPPLLITIGVSDLREQAASNCEARRCVV